MQEYRCACLFHLGDYTLLRDLERVSDLTVNLCLADHLRRHRRVWLGGFPIRRRELHAFVVDVDPAFELPLPHAARSHHGKKQGKERSPEHRRERYRVTVSILR